MYKTTALPVELRAHFYFFLVASYKSRALTTELHARIFYFFLAASYKGGALTTKLLAPPYGESQIVTAEFIGSFCD